MKRGKSEPDKLPYEDPLAAALRAFRGHLELEETEAALGVYRRARERLRVWRPPPREWMDLIKALLTVEERENAIEVMEDYVAEAEAPSPRVRLKLAQLLLQGQPRPARALRVLEAIPDGALPEPLDALRVQLRARAQLMRDEGPPELDDP
jgi:hypothetical protein